MNGFPETKEARQRGMAIFRARLLKAHTQQLALAEQRLEKMKKPSKKRDAEVANIILQRDCISSIGRAQLKHNDARFA